MKKIFTIFCLIISFSLSAQNRREDIDHQIQEIMKAREEMIKSLFNDSGFNRLDFDEDFDDLIKKFQQHSFGEMPGVDAGAVVGEYDWRETETHQILALKVNQMKDKPLDIKIEKGQIKLKGDVESVFEEQSKNTKRISKVHFERSFSIPEGVDQTKPEFENIGGELLIKFKKLKVSDVAPKVNHKEPNDKLRPIGKALIILNMETVKFRIKKLIAA